jgi:hypothetical protein
MTSIFSLRRAAALSCAGAALLFTVGTARAAEDDDTINPDRPDVVESSRVVGHGRVQLETGLQWERQRDASSHERATYTPTLLRIGVGEAFELRVETDGRTIVHASDPVTGMQATTAGYADIAVGVKWHVADQQGARPSLGVLVDAALPSGSRVLRGHGVRPGLNVSAEWELGDGWDAAVMPGIGIERGDAAGRFGYGVFAATVGRALTPRTHAFVEVAAQQIARASHGGTHAVVDGGLTWLVDRDCALDVAVGHGLNRRSPDLTLGFGVSIRR